MSLAVTRSLEHLASSTHQSWNLQLDKFSATRDGGETAKTDALARVRETYSRCAETVLNDAVQSKLRFLRSLAAQHGDRYRTVDLVAESRIIVHLGRPSVLTNVGLHADLILGLPLIPGTTLKGVVSNWACWESNQRPDGSFPAPDAWARARAGFKAEWTRRILGDNSDGSDARGGDVVFLGGFPLEVPHLGWDLVNPHHEPSGAPKRRLTPNAFLCIEPGSGWRFAFHARPGADDPRELLRVTQDWITGVLTELGIGAKTASGYGRFRLPDQESIRTWHANDERERRRTSNAAARGAAIAELQSDYPSLEVYRNAVLRPAGNPGQWTMLQREIEKLRKPENSRWLDQFRRDTGDRSFRRLREQSWYPR